MGLNLAERFQKNEPSPLLFYSPLITFNVSGGGGNQFDILLHFVAPRGNKNKAMITSGRSMI